MRKKTPIKYVIQTKHYLLICRWKFDHDFPTEVYINIYDKQDKTYYLNTQPRTRLFYLVLGAFEEVVLSARGGGHAAPEICSEIV